jgi:hypothetical protein
MSGEHIYADKDSFQSIWILRPHLQRPDLLLTFLDPKALVEPSLLFPSVV